MSDPSNNEQRLTAYFDGELSEDERAVVERLLSENAEYRQQLDSWKQSGDRLRALPRYRLDESFASQVMRKIVLAKNEATTPKPTPTLPSHWRIGFAAIATLAAMLLLTLFVFPGLSDPKTLAYRTADEALDSTSSTLGGLVSKSGPVTDGLIESGDQASLDENGPLNDETMAEKPGASLKPQSPSKSADKLFDQADQSQFAEMESGSSLPRPPSVMSRSGKEYGDGKLDVEYPQPSSEASSESQKLQPNKLADGGSGLGGGVRAKGGFSGTAAKPMVPTHRPAAKFLASDSPRIDSSVVGDSDARPSEFAFVENEISADLEQVLMIDMPNETQPLAVIGEVFFRNQIEIVTPESDADRANQLQFGIEALYVVSTQSQMQQAILELSDQANISGYQIPQRGMIPNQSLPNSPFAQEKKPAIDLAADGVKAEEQRDNAIGNQESLKDADSELVENKKSESPFAGNQFRDAEPTDLRAQVINSSAQQLQPYSLGLSQANSRYSAKSGYQVEEANTFFRNQSVADNQSGGNASPESPTSAELIRYLLFVRMSTKEFSESDAAGSLREPSQFSAPKK